MAAQGEDINSSPPEPKISSSPKPASDPPNANSDDTQPDTQPDTQVKLKDEDEDEEIRNLVGDDGNKSGDAQSSSSHTRQLNTSDPASVNFDGTNDDDGGGALPASLQADVAMGESVREDVEAEATISQKKDATLREFLGRMDDYAPIIPDAVTNHYLTLAGLPPPPQTPPRLARLLALATQKFVADIAADAYQYARIRTSHTTSNTANAMMGAGLGLPGQSGPGASGPGGPGGVAGVGGGAGGVGGGKDAGGKAAIGLGVQRPGFGGGGQGGGQGRTVLTMEDLGMAVGEYGVNVKRGEFYR